MQTLEGMRPPSYKTVGSVGDLYLDTSSGITYKLVRITTIETDRKTDKTYQWSNISNPLGEIDPLIPDWARQPTKPKYTASEVGAATKAEVQQMIEEAIPDIENGEDGFSPTANVVKTSTGATITITDKSGTTTVDISNGKNGAAGATGPKGDKGDTGAAGAKGDKGETGATGAAGKSAYEYAKEGGYTGTETEFAQKLAELLNA